MVCVSPVRCGTGCVWCRTGYVLPVRCGTGCVWCRTGYVLPVRYGIGCIIICEVKDAVCFTCEVWDRVRLV